MSKITTHVLDTSRGKPAAGVPIVLSLLEPGGNVRELGRGQTDGDGRLRTLLAQDAQLDTGIYRLRFETATYFRHFGMPVFFPEVVVQFAVGDPEQHYHVPLLLSPYGYSTYRGS